MTSGLPGPHPPNVTALDPDDVAQREPVDGPPGEAAVRAAHDANVRRRPGSAPPGLLANMVMRGRDGVIGTITLGIIGAVVGGYLALAMLHKGDVTGVNSASIVIAVVGAILVLFVWRALTRNRTS